MKKLVVFTPAFGTLSETFIKRHVEDLAPGQTVVVCLEKLQDNPGKWDENIPVFSINDYNSRKMNLAEKVGKSLSKKLTGNKISNHQDIAIKNFLGEHKVNVALGEYLGFSLRFLDILNELDIPFYAHGHGYDVSAHLRLQNTVKRYQKLNTIHGVITMSEYSRRKLADSGLNREKIHVIHYGVMDPGPFERRDPGGTIRLLSVGRMVNKKAPVLLLDAFRRASERIQGIRLDYIGGGPLQNAAWQYVKAFGLEDKVRLHGAIPNEKINSFFKNSDIFIQHSIECPETGDSEGLPVVILEAMSYGLPVISTRHAGIPEEITDGLNGFLVDELDTAGMALKIEMLATDTKKRYEMGQKSREIFQEKFTWNINKDLINSLLKI